ncbi:uncharacterized protein KY384_001233 [Bacidia gigantensis]|uniref:uncharacterized protein n=1 Tax=Bacidia gigantensis TaxID=2732470 RepID=UPI001D05ACF7|nr:uncharacterized protein KY384_001233 [Bacidia gigantensis]KAG8534388.1 hypothetical protein KY384_001233 [Bacidia gigantensis]
MANLFSITLVNVLSILSLVNALPQLQSRNPLATRDDIPPIPPRPDNVGKETFHGSQFQFFDQHGFVAGSPGVEAAPVFLFSRTQKIYDPCYPESAVVIGSNPPKPNPGTDGDKGTASVNPGADCTNPGTYNGAYTLGNPFPVYVGAAYCGDTWRVNYDLYYVHDGVMLEGHKHDWEGATVVFKKDPSGADWWYRDSIIDNEHGWKNHYGWGDIITVNVDTGEFTDVKDETVGKRLNHPKVYVGFFSHSAFPDKDTSRQTITATKDKSIADDEYRSNDWWRLPRGGDMHLWSEINKDWKYGDADSTPPSNHDNMCGW